MKDFRKKVKIFLGSLMATFMPASIIASQTINIYAKDGYHTYHNYDYYSPDNFAYRWKDSSTGAFEAYCNWGGYGDQVKMVFVSAGNGQRTYDIYGGKWGEGKFYFDYRIIKDFSYNTSGHMTGGNIVAYVSATNQYGESWASPTRVSFAPGNHTLWVCVWNDLTWTASFMKMEISVPDYKSYNIHYNPGKPTKASANVKGSTVDQTQIGVNVATNLSKNGYSLPGWTFVGWSRSDKDTTASYTDGQSVTGLTEKNGETISLYAVWKQNQYNVVYKAGGGSGSDYSQTCIYDNGEAYQYLENRFGTPTKTGYTYSFKNWRTQGGSYVNPKASFSNLTTSGTYELTANWNEQANRYYVVYNKNASAVGHKDSEVIGTIYGADQNGKQLENKDQLEYDKEQRLSANQFELTGYTFVGWTSKADGSGTLYSDGQEVVNLAATEGAVFNLYAKWEPITYTIDFNSNGGIGTSMTPIENVKYDGAEKDVPKNTYAKTGYEFVEWNTQPDGSGKSFIPGTSKFKNETTVDKDTVIVYAQWKARQYTIKFNGNTSTSGTMSDQTMTYDKIEKLTANSFKKKGYYFESWNTKKDGSGTSYVDKDSVSNLCTGEDNNKTITLYARWRPIRYQVTFERGHECKENCSS